MMELRSLQTDDYNYRTIAARPRRAWRGTWLGRLLFLCNARTRCDTRDGRLSAFGSRLRHSASDRPVFLLAEGMGALDGSCGNVVLLVARE
jgi:hypothetical protein